MYTSSGEQIRTISPSTNKVILERQAASLDDARGIVSASKAAFASWRKVSFEERKAIVSRALQTIQERKHDLGQELTLQMGRPISYSVKEIETMQKRAKYLFSIADGSLQDVPGQLEEGFRRWVRKVPVGPVLIIFAWNVSTKLIFVQSSKHSSSSLSQFPYLIIANALIPALLTGNTVILKPSPQTPLIGERFVEIFAEAGLPANTLQVLHSGNPSTLKQIVQIPEIQLITFTGSTKVGLDLREATARRCVPLNLELGGNDPAYVRQDADLKYVAQQLVDGAVFNSGQSCCAVERVYAHSDIYNAFLQELRLELSR